MFGARALIVVALTTAVIAAGCGGSDGSQSNGSTDSTTVETTTPTVTEPVTTTAPTTSPKPKPKPKPTTITISVVDGVPQGGIARPSVKKNDRVVLIVRSDTADEVHLHGYDISRPVAAGGRARLPFVAKIPGRFEVELEESGVQIAELTVR